MTSFTVTPVLLFHESGIHLRCEYAYSSSLVVPYSVCRHCLRVWLAVSTVNNVSRDVGATQTAITILNQPLRQPRVLQASLYARLSHINLFRHTSLRQTTTLELINHLLCKPERPSFLDGEHPTSNSIVSLNEVFPVEPWQAGFSVGGVSMVEILHFLNNKLRTRARQR